MTKIQRLGLSGLTFLLTFFVFALGSAQSSVPSAPRNVEVFINGEDGRAFIHWEIEDNKDLAANYKVFLAQGQATASDKDRFEQVADFSGSDVAVESNPDGRTFAYYLVDLKLQKPGPYSLFMIAYNEDGDSKMSNIAYFVNDYFNMGHLRISSMPKEIARIGEQYTYQPVTEYINEPIKNAAYMLDEGPEGMAFTKSGLLTWTPKESGVVHVLITSAATIDGKEMICFQKFRIIVSTCSEPTFVSGTVKHESGAPADGLIIIVSADFLDIIKDSVNNGEEPGFQQYTGWVKGGEYRIPVDKGEFLVYFQSNENNPNMPESRGEWFENVDNPEDAKIVKVDCGNNISVNMIVNDVINMVKVSGSVKYEDEGNYPDIMVPYAYVEFFPITGDSTSGWTGAYYAHVDNHGYFETELPDLFDYKAAASLYGSTDDNSIFVQYYNLKDNFEEADLIVLDGEKDDINFVFEKPEHKVVSGKVSFSDGSPYADAMVRIHTSTGVLIYTMMTDVNGEYSQKVIAGQDYVALAVNGFDTFGKRRSVQYYNMAYKLEDAEIIKMTEDRSGIDFVFVKPVLRQISGLVTYEDDTPVIGATVEFESYETVVKDSNGVEYGLDVYFVISTSTDKEGNYTLDLPENAIGIVSALNYHHNSNKSREILFYNQTYHRDEAEELKLDQDYGHINFVFGEKPGGNTDAVASALVRVTNLQSETLTDVIVFAFKVGSDMKLDPDMYNGFSAAPNAEGDFMFRELPIGDYVFFAFPMNGEYAPGLYKEGEQAVWSWKDATRVTLEADKKIYGPYTIILPLIVEIKGIAVLEGNISSGQIGIMEDAGDLTVTGASVYLINASGSASKYVKSNSKGDYRITGIADGIYTLVVDKVGFDKYTKTVEILNGASLDSEDSQDISLIPENTTSVDDRSDFASQVKVYPNPAVDNISISYQGTAGITNIRIINTVGSEMFSVTVNSVNGTNEYRFNSLNLASGPYYIKIENGQHVQMIPLTVVR